MGGIYLSFMAYERFSLPSGKIRTARYIPAWQLIGTWTGHYRVVPLRSTVGGRFWPSTVDFYRLRSIEEEKEKKKKRKRRRIRRRGGREVPRAALSVTPPGGRPRAVAARGIEFE
ncbi:hypothetical protein B296_00051821, partial [Ensete ventricosum]